MVDAVTSVETARRVLRSGQNALSAEEFAEYQCCNLIRSTFARAMKKNKEWDDFVMEARGGAKVVKGRHDWLKLQTEV